MLVFATASLGAVQAVDFAALEGRLGPEANIPKGPLSYTQLRNEIMDFADRYMQMIGQAADTLQRNSKDPDARAGIHSMKLFPVSAAFSIATDSSAQMALLDMVVLVHLQGMVWQETAPTRFDKDASILLDVQKDLQNEIDDIALRVMNQEQVSRLKTLVLEWHKAHPKQRYVSYIRFADFADMRQPDTAPGRSPNILSIGGLLSAFQLVNVDEASRSVDQARNTAERAIYLAERMPTLMRWQTEMLFYSLASSPESKSMVETSASLRTLPDRLGAALTRSLVTFALVIFGLALLYKFLVRKFFK